MIKINADNGAVMVHSEGSSLVLAAEAVGANVALAETIAKVKHVSFENATLFLMQESIRLHNMAHEVEEHEH